jgi:hypothetical protein
MKVKASATLSSAHACRIHDHLANLTYSAWEECDYCAPSLTILNDGSFIASGESCEGNYCSIEYNAACSTLYLEINSRRHALHDEGNCAGAVFALLNLDVLKTLEVQEYDSWRRDVPFWHCGLTRSPKMDAQRNVLSEYFRRFRHDVWRDHFLNYDPDRKILVFHTAEEGVEWGRPATDFLDGMDYRRLAAEGIKP